MSTVRTQGNGGNAVNLPSDQLGPSEVAPRAAVTRNIELPPPRLKLPQTAEQVVDGSGVVSTVQHANQVLRIMDGYRTTQNGTAQLAAIFSSTTSTNPAFRGMNGHQLFEAFSSALTALTGSINSNSFRQDSAATSSLATAVRGLTREWQNRLS